MHTETATTSNQTTDGGDNGDPSENLSDCRDSADTAEMVDNNLCSSEATDHSPQNTAESSNLCGRTVSPELTTQRRKLVARLSIRGLAPNEICERVASAGISHADGTSFSIRTIYNDISFLDENVYSDTIEEAEKHRNRVLAELREVKRSAWESRQLAVVLKAIKQEADLCKLNSEEAQTKPTAEESNGVPRRVFEDALRQRLDSELTREERRTDIKIRKIKIDVLGELLGRTPNGPAEN